MGIKKLWRSLSGPKIYTATFPGPDTVYYYRYSDGSIRYFDSLEDLTEYVKERDNGNRETG